MNKLRRVMGQIPSTPVDKNLPGSIKGGLPGNMRGYASKPEPKTMHFTSGKMPGNMMGYAPSKGMKGYPAISDESQNYGPKRLKEPTRSGFDGKTLPPQMKNYVAINPDNPEWVQIQTAPKKKGAYYGK